MSPFAESALVQRGDLARHLDRHDAQRQRAADRRIGEPFVRGVILRARDDDHLVGQSMLPLQRQQAAREVGGTPIGRNEHGNFHR